MSNDGASGTGTLVDDSTPFQPEIAWLAGCRPATVTVML